ncbi:MAG: YfiR/HmsC family protein [Bacteroidales bacterium]|nr:YfiR/HmsC family protein [Bacteroidales bacterium]
MAGANGNAFGQMQPEILRADLIVKCSEIVEWNEFKNPDVFTIGVYGSMAEEVNPLREITKNRKISGRPIQIVQFTRVKDITPTDMLFVNNRQNESLEQIYNQAVSNKTLLITDHAQTDKYFMINILLEGKDNQYELNAPNLKNSNATISSDKFTRQGGSTLDYQEIYAKKLRDLKAREDVLNEQLAQVEERKQEMEKQLEENRRQESDNIRLRQLVDQTAARVNQEKNDAAILIQHVQSQQYQLQKNQDLIEKQVREIDVKNAQINQAKEQTLMMEQTLNDQVKRLERQMKDIDVQDQQINTNRNIIIGVVVFILVVIVLVVLIIKSLRERMRANVMLRQKNQELTQQTKEINEQAKQLENVNKELEKLSIVAGKTQNAIVIMDRNGYFEWVNAGFTRFFGYTLQLLRNERDENIVNVSSNKSIRNILFKCVSNKQTIVFESDAVTRSGQVIAAQTTLSPIINKKGDVSQLVAIYSDITKLKEQEVAIRNQNEELQQQNHTLEVQKTQIEEQTKSIKAGIYYAQTIQQTILPPKEQIERYFDCFILFRPKDIVSGDFYWFSEAQDGIHSYQFVGDFDCTGHGVPGAFMSLIGNRILNEVINVRKTYSPRDIMDELNLNVIKALKQDQSTNNDGMDTCLCRVEKTSLNEYKVLFCGAKRPLYYITTDVNDVQELKGDRKSIGGTQKKRGNIQFTDQELTLHSGDMLFLCSDGISDQCDKDRKKFSSDRLRGIFLQNSGLPMDTQGQLLSEALDNYRGEEEQRDDISVIGIKFR